MRHFSQPRGFTLVELLLTMGLIGVVGAGIFVFGSTAYRFVARNLATNHSHETTRISSLTFLKELRDAASSFRLVDFNGTNYTDVTPMSSSEIDELSGDHISTRANGVRFRKLVGGPFVLQTKTTPTTAVLTFDFRPDSNSDYVPVPGDKVVLPLISREYEITAVGGSFSPTGSVTIVPAIGYTLDTTKPNIITGYFYRRVAFTVADDELRYHPNFTGAERANYRVVRGGITSPKPFSLLFPTSTSLSTDALNLRVSMEVTDLGYSSHRFRTGTTTHYSIYPPRNQPTAVSSTN